MAEKNVVKVVIDGKPVTVGGYESADYLGRVAYYINSKIAELRELPGYKRYQDDMRTILLALNIADDYYKAKLRADSMEDELESRDSEGYETKRKLVDAQMRIKELERQLSSYQSAHAPVQMKLDMSDDPKRRR